MQTDNSIPDTIENAIGYKLMLGFHGTQPPADLLATIRQHAIGGVTLFRAMNLESPEQTRQLTAALQSAARAAQQPSLLIAADQEGGTLMAVPGTTRFPGNLALGATRSADLSYRTGFAIGRELSALGINLNYAPVCDVINNPQNPVVGPRSFGGDPILVAQLSAAMIEGLQAAGVAAAAKHFPGHGDISTDPHFGTPIVPHDEARLRAIEFPPFSAAVHAGVRTIMTAHIALPRFNGGSKLPATLSPKILRGFLRDELGFAGVIISDALDMHAITQGHLLVIEALTAVAAGCDLLLLTAFVDQPGVYDGLLHAARRGLLAQEDILASANRVLALKRWIGQQPQPALDVVGCAEHLALAEEIAARSITLVRDEAQLLPLHLPATARIAVIVPRPKDLTPADTSSYDHPALADAVRIHHAAVAEFSMPIDPPDAEVAALRQQLNGYDLVILGTINATQHHGQAALVNALIESGMALIAIALRMPYDVNAFPRVGTYLCTYSLQPPALDAVAKALWGQLPFAGQLPVDLPRP